MESDLGKLFIGGISWDTDEERLKEHFSKYGEVVEAVIMRDRTTGRARGFGFVVFADSAVAERVIMDKHVIDGRMVEAKKAVPKDEQQVLNRNASSVHSSPGPGRTKKIFVGGLASTVTDKDFKKYFEQFGNITDVVVMYDHNTQRPRGFGFITYDSDDAVDRVLHSTFHELNGKMVEVKRAVPKELSPGPNRSPMIGYNYGLSRTNNFLNAYAQGYNINSAGGFAMRMDSRFSPVASGRNGFPPFGNTGYGIGMNLEPGLTPNYGGGSNFGNNPGYGRMLSPYYSMNSSRYNTSVGFGIGNVKNDSVLSPTTHNVWGNGGLNTAADPASPGSFLGSGSGSFEVSFGSNGANWGPSHVSAQGGNASPYTCGRISYGSSDSSYGSGGGGYGRNNGSGAAPNSSFSGSTGGFEASCGDLYSRGSVYGDSTWQSGNPELKGSASFGYGLGKIASEVNAKNSDGCYIGSYGVTSRQSNRGIAA